MITKGIIEEDFINYKKPSMFIAFPYCSFKCDKEFGSTICQNSALAKQKNIEIDDNVIVDKYISNPISEAIVFGGLEPFDSYYDLLSLVQAFRKKTNDDIIIYTGYKPEELNDKIMDLYNIKNIIIKYGRYIPNDKKHFDDILGIELASNNQFARRIN